MTAATVQLSRVSGLIAQPATVIDRGFQESALFNITVATDLATTQIDDVGDITLLCPVPWNARIVGIRILNDDMDSHSTPTLATDVGLYKMTKDGTVTVLDADAYASAITTLQAANLTGVQVAFESTVKDIDATDTGKRVIEDAGLTAQPQDGFCILGLTITTAAATAVAGSIRVDVTYTM